MQQQQLSEFGNKQQHLSEFGNLAFLDDLAPHLKVSADLVSPKLEPDFDDFEQYHHPIQTGEAFASC